jgi:TonB family protein
LKLTSGAALEWINAVFGGLVRGGEMAGRASFGSWIAMLMTCVIAAFGCTAVYGGPPINDHAREAALMTAELGFTLDYDVPPKPERITRPMYPRRAFEGCVEGAVVLLIGIDTSGSVSASKVVESTDGLDEAALACVKNWHFTPARKGGVAVGTVAVAPVTFRIYDDKAKRHSPCKGKMTAPLQ